MFRNSQLLRNLLSNNIMIDNLDLTEDEIMYYKAYSNGILNEIKRKRDKQTKSVFAINKKDKLNKEIERTRKKPTYDIDIKTLPKEYCSYYTRSFNKKRQFELTVDQFYGIANKNCEYCGKEGLNGVDRVDNKIGYTVTNCVACCSQCNHMKFIYSKEKFLEQIVRIFNHNNLNGQK